jgi:Fe-Mn family superoxide dismutase
MFVLPKLPYSYDALEPYIDAQTMEIHYTKHHQAYIDNLNKALEGHEALQDKPLIDILRALPTLPEGIRTAVRNNGGGHFNHTFFWTLMRKGGGGAPRGQVADALTKQFGDLKMVQNQFNTAAKSVFGSGWAWLVVDAQGKLQIITTANQDSPVSMGLSPIMGLDVWEHAYYLKYQNRRVDYITAWWNVIDWDQVEENYRQLI